MFVEKMSDKDIKYLVKYTINADRHETFSYKFLEITVKYKTKTNSYYAYVVVEVENAVKDKNKYYICMTDDNFKAEKVDYNAKSTEFLVVKEPKYDGKMYQMVYRKGMNKLFGKEYDQFLFDKYIAKTM